jgi:site-specific DNA-methyltransferase (adenine-specific)
MWTWQDVDEYHLDALATQNLELSHFITNVGSIHSKAMMAYLTYMAQRIIEMHRILKPTGSLYLHCDQTASHYLKIVLDSIFCGRGGTLRNEIIWDYSFRLMDLKNIFNRKHDVILIYSKSENNKFLMPKTEWTREDLIASRKQKIHVDANGEEWIWMPGGKGKSKNKMRRVTEIIQGGKAISDVWPIPIISSSSRERTGYPTQKPLALLNRIIEASSCENDIVLDPFCGCATTCVAAERLKRKWIGIDIEEKATDILIKRLDLATGLLNTFISTTKPPSRSDLKEVQPSEPIKQRLYKEQNKLCNACGNEFEIRNLEIDHIIPRSKGGGDYYENYQLLCGSCNRIKGDRPMEYLRAKIATIEKVKGKVFFGE